MKTKIFITALLLVLGCVLVQVTEQHSGWEASTGSQAKAYSGADGSLSEDYG